MTEAGGWRYVHASVPGVAHLASGADCQDACAVELLSAPDIGPVPVSYTHLDVYKRQVWTWAESRKYGLVGRW